MAIYIKGVEMPAEGVLCIDIFPDGRVAGHYDCTIEQARAVSIPSHGRLIDAEKLIRDLGIGDLLIALTQKIQNAPSVIESDAAEDHRDWAAAKANIDMLIPLYAEIGTPGLFGLLILLQYRDRYNAGERSSNLYESMMEAE